MTRNKFLSMWGALLAAVGVGKAQTDTSVPLEHGLWTSIPYRHHVYLPNHCPVCGTKDAKDSYVMLQKFSGSDDTFVGYSKAITCPTCQVVWVREDLPLRINGEGK
jgi:hypothetical protein